MSFLLGIDIGTTSARTIIVGKEGTLAASSSKGYPLITPRPGWTEQNPEDWWECVVYTIKEAISSTNIASQEIECIGLTGQMHGSVFLDRNGQVIRPAILWNDQRTFKQYERIYDIFGYKDFIKLSYNKALPGFTAPKIMWLEENEPDNFKKVHKVILPKDYIRYRLSGKYITDVSDASGTILLDVGKRCWSEQILEGLKIKKSLLPQLCESQDITSEVSMEAARATGLSQGTPIAGGASDTTAGAVGSGTLREGFVSNLLGTSGIILASSDKPLYEEEGRIHCWCHSSPHKWLVASATLAAAGSLRWYHDQFGPSEDIAAQFPHTYGYKLLDKQAEKVSAGSDGLIFLPYLSGERYLSGTNSRYGDPHARGVFFGISHMHTQDHFVRSILEGVAYSLLDCLLIMEDQGIQAEKVALFAGGARSSIWKQIIADVFNKTIVRINIDEGSAYGAALIAGSGCGMFSSVEDITSKIIKEVETITPIDKNVSTYQKLYPIYKSLYEGIKGNFRPLN